MEAGTRVGEAAAGLFAPSRPMSFILPPEQAAPRDQAAHTVDGLASVRPAIRTVILSNSPRLLSGSSKIRFMGASRLNSNARDSPRLAMGLIRNRRHNPIPLRKPSRILPRNKHTTSNSLTLNSRILSSSSNRTMPHRVARSHLHRAGRCHHAPRAPNTLHRRLNNGATINKRPTA